MSGAKCEWCGHYELDVRRPETRHAPCRSCGSFTRWLPKLEDDTYDVATGKCIEHGPPKRSPVAERTRLIAAVAALETAQAAYGLAYREIGESCEGLGNDAWQPIRERMHAVSTSIEELGRLLRRARDGR